MKIKVYESYGFAGTDSTWTEEIPEEVIAKGDSAIEEYLEEMRIGLWDAMCERLSLTVEIEE